MRITVAVPFAVPVMFTAVVTSGACGKPPAAREPPAELRAEQVTDLVGKWVAADDMDWGYSMTIAPEGVIRATRPVWSIRNGSSRCSRMYCRT